MVKIDLAKLKDQQTNKQMKQFVNCYHVLVLISLTILFYLVRQSIVYINSIIKSVEVQDKRLELKLSVNMVNHLK